MKKEYRLMLGVFSSALILLAIVVLVLKLLGIINSPTFEEVIFTWLVGLTSKFFEFRSDVLGEMKELKTKLDLVWHEFKKRKKI